MERGTSSQSHVGLRGTWAFGITRGEEGAKNNVPSESWHMVVVFFQKLNCILDVVELSLGWEPHNFVT